MVNKNNLKKIVVLTFVAFSILPTIASAQAETNVGDGTTAGCVSAQLNGTTVNGGSFYCLLTPLPEFGNAYKPGDLPNFVLRVIYLLITVAAVLAVVQISVGGFKYMTSDNFGLKNEGRSQMEGAVIGILVLAASYLILNTINPNILKFQLNIDGVSTPGKVTVTNSAEVKDSKTTESLDTTRSAAGLTTTFTKDVEARSSRPEDAQQQIRSQLSSLKTDCGSGKLVAEDSNVNKVGDVWVAKSKVTCVAK